MLIRQKLGGLGYESFKYAPFESLFSSPQKNGLTRPKKVRGSGIPMVNMGELFAYSRIKDINMDLVPVGDGEAHFLLQPDDLLFIDNPWF